VKVVERAAVALDVAEEPNTKPQKWNQPTTLCVMDPMIETMQLTESVKESRDNMGPLVQVEEHQVDNATNMQKDDVRVEEVAAEGQMMNTQTALGEKQRPSKQKGTRKGGGVYESGGEGMGSEYSPPEKVTLTTTPPSYPKPTINFEWNGKSRHRRDGKVEREREQSPRPNDRETPSPRLLVTTNARHLQSCHP
jgi:hypothetical protein